jgi:predicted AlkP superfamily phosphohydrolase/phosphomutase
LLAFCLGGAAVGHAGIEEWSDARVRKLLEGLESPDSARRSGQGRVVVIGLDGFTPYFFDVYMREGLMPNIAQVMARGCWGILESTLVPSSAVAWTAAFTGVAGGRSGISSFFARGERPGELRLVNSSYRRARALWEYLSDSGRVAVAINVPGSFPPDPVRGVLVAGLLSQPGRVFTTPAWLSERLSAAGYQTGAVPIAPVRRAGETPFDPRAGARNLDDLFTNSYNRARLALHLYRRVDWDLFFVVFTISDRLQHARHLIPEEVLRGAYVNLDRVVGYFIEMLPADAQLVLLSDHGFRPYPRAALVNRWLAEQGLAAVREGKLAAGASRCFSVNAVGNVAAIHVPRRPNEGPAERERVLAELREKAASWRDPTTGAPVVRRVVCPEGPWTADPTNLVDAVLELDHHYMSASSLPPGTRAVARLDPPVFDHDRRGFYALRGSRLARGRTSAAIPDIGALVLHLLGEPLPGADGGLDGVVHDSWRAPSERGRALTLDSGRSPFRRRTVTESADSEELMDRLRALGYIQ